MIEGIRLSAAGAKAQSLRHDVIANNLANVNTAGFRRQLAILGVQGKPASGLHLTAPSPSSSPAVVATVPQVGQGSLIQTDRRTDLALDGEGYFVVSDGRRQFYTRAGHFDLDETGRLVTADHRFHVEDVNGGAIQVDRSLPFTVTQTGDVMQNGTVVGRVAVVTFRDPEALRGVGAGLLAASGEEPSPTRLATVRQGYLEHSTVEAVRELVAMLEASRAYEANLNLITNQDATLGRLINEAGRGV